MYDISHPNLYHLLERRRLQADLKLLAELMGERRPLRVVDVGAGTGRLTLPFALRGWEVTAVDCSARMLQQLRQRYERAPAAARLELVCATVEDFLAHAAGDFDLFAFSSVLHHLPDPVDVVSRCLQRLRIGGCIYITQEPLPAPRPRPIAEVIVQALDEVARTPQQLYRQVYRRLHRLPLARAGELVDVHVARGIDLPALEGALTAAGVQRHRFVAYADRKTALVAWLDDHLFFSPRRCFRYIGQKVG